MYYKNYIIQPSRIYPSYARPVQHLKTGIIHHIKRLKKKNHMIISTDTEKQSIWQNPSWQWWQYWVLQYSCLENPMDRGAWRATVYRVANSQTRLKELSMAQQHPSKIKTVSIFLNLTRDISKNRTPNTMLNVRNLMIRSKERYSLTTAFQHHTGSSR